MDNEIKVVIFDRAGALTKPEKSYEANDSPSYMMELRASIVALDLVSVLNLLFPVMPVGLAKSAWGNVYASLQPVPLADKLARRCQQAGLSVGLVANSEPEVVKELFVSEPVGAIAKQPAVSCFVGRAMPDREIYSTVEALFGVKAYEILFLSAHDAYLEGAQARGWQTLKVTGVKQMYREASRLLELA